MHISACIIFQAFNDQYRLHYSQSTQTDTISIEFSSKHTWQWTALTACKSNTHKFSTSQATTAQWQILDIWTMNIVQWNTLHCNVLHAPENWMVTVTCEQIVDLSVDRCGHGGGRAPTDPGGTLLLALSATSGTCTHVMVRQARWCTGVGR